MVAGHNSFEESISRQISLNRARSPTDRLIALCDLLDAARALAPRDPAACERRRRAQAARAQNQEEMRAHFRRILATQREDTAGSV
ncbi:MAG: hypothetical protein ACE5EC_02975 [Phycisphaerae bacterium]